MMNRNLSRRLERLEEQIAPLIVRKVWQIMTINSDGTTEPSGLSFEWSSNLAPNSRQGVSRRFDRKDERRMTADAPAPLIPDTRVEPSIENAL